MMRIRRHAGTAAIVGVLACSLPGCKKDSASDQTAGPVSPATQQAMDESRNAPPPVFDPPPGEPAAGGTGTEQLRETR